jgi:hypothetical protein
MQSVVTIKRVFWFFFGFLVVILGPKKRWPFLRFSFCSPIYSQPAVNLLGAELSRAELEHIYLSLVRSRPQLRARARYGSVRDVHLGGEGGGTTACHRRYLCISFVVESTDAGGTASVRPCYSTFWCCPSLRRLRFWLRLFTLVDFRLGCFCRHVA